MDEPGMMRPFFCGFQAFKALKTAPHFVYSVLSKLVFSPRLAGGEGDQVILALWKCADIRLQILKHMEPKW